MKLKKCVDCGEYSLGEKCKCGGEVKSAHYKFVKVRDCSYLPEEGRLVFEYGGNRRNPDSLSLDRTYIEIGDNKIALHSDESSSHEILDHLENWFNKQPALSL